MFIFVTEIAPNLLIERTDVRMDLNIGSTLRQKARGKMSEKCPQCGNADFRLDLINKKVICNMCGDKSIPFPEIRKCPIRLSIFQRITTSPEVLAEKLVYCVANSWGKLYWMSTVIGEKKFPSRNKAIAATVAKLKEMAE